MSVANRQGEHPERRGERGFKWLAVIEGYRPWRPLSKSARKITNASSGERRWTGNRSTMSSGGYSTQPLTKNSGRHAQLREKTRLAQRRCLGPSSSMRSRLISIAYSSAISPATIFGWCCDATPMANQEENPFGAGRTVSATDLVNYPALLAPSRLAPVGHSLRTGLLPQRHCTPVPVHGRGTASYYRPRSGVGAILYASYSNRDEDCPADLIPGVLALYPNIGNGSRTRSRSSFPSIGCEVEDLAPQEPVYSWLLLTRTFAGIAVPSTWGTESLTLPVSAVFDALLPSLLAAPFRRSAERHRSLRKGTPRCILLTEIKRVAEELGHTPTTTEFREGARCSLKPIYNRFGSWEGALRLIGRKPHEPRKPSKQIEDAELIEEIQRLAGEVDGTPSMNELEKQGRYSGGVYFERFGSWSNAVELAGFVPNTKSDQPKRYTDTELLEAISEKGAELGRRPTSREVVSDQPFSRNVFHLRFGGWLNAAEEAGYGPTKRDGWTPPGVLIDEMLQIAGDLGRIPRTTDLHGHSDYRKQDYRKAFGSWNEALRTAGLPVETRRGPLREGETRTWDDYGQNWKEQRARTIVRDRAQCQDCGIGYEAHREEFGGGLEVHHIIPVLEFDEPEDANFQENLITLCKKCHKKWEPITQAEFSERFEEGGR